MGLKVTPCLPQVSSHSTAWKKASSMESDHIIGVSSTHLVFREMSDTISSKRRLYPSPEAMYPAFTSSCKLVFREMSDTISSKRRLYPSPEAMYPAFTSSCQCTGTGMGQAERRVSL